VTIGDRLFRAGNLHRAAERYEQAMNADPNAAAPRIRLAQIAVVRGQYGEAANRYREALTAEPGWLINAPDIQAIYGEPGEFAKQVAKLETHLQAQPNDRDAWLVLGAQWYLSGKSRKAADVFLRLTDRQGDATLEAFLDASTPRRPGPQ
jgi:Tfp pilus assembly protein PilF